MMPSDSNPLPSILLVDDEIRILESLERLLADDFEVYTAHSVDQAFDILTRQSIQVVVSDQRMPGMSGVEFLKQVRDDARGRQRT